MGRIVVIGSSNTDLISKMDSFPAPGETIEGTFFLQAMGGKGANQALAAHKLGGDVQFITCLGRDNNGENTLRYYKEQNLDISLVITVPDTPSGTAMIWVDRKGENCIVINSGANALLSPSHIEALESVIAGADMVILQMEIPYETVQRICDIAHLNDTRIMLNVAPARKLDAQTIRKTDILVVNEIEAETISGERISALGEEGVVDKLRELGAPAVVLTLGKRGCLFKSGDASFCLPAYDVKTVDSTAAGDIFCGALAARLGKGEDWRNALKFATAASALCVMRMGAQPSIPSEREVLEFMKDHFLNLEEMKHKE